MDDVLELPAPRGVDNTAEEWSLEAFHWMILFAAAGVAWFISRRTSSGNGSATRSESKPDAEELRRKRMEALYGAAGGASPNVAATVYSCGVEDGTLRKRVPHDQKDAPSISRIEQFSVQVRGLVNGSSSIQHVDGLVPSSTVRDLTMQVQAAFSVETSTRVELFVGGKELNRLDAVLSKVGVFAGVTLQARFLQTIGAAMANGTVVASSRSSAAPTKVATAQTQSLQVQDSSSETAQMQPSTSSSASPVADTVSPLASSQPLSIRVHGSFGDMNGASVEGLMTTSVAHELENHIAHAFSLPQNVGMRLFYLGREIKDANASLGSFGLRSSCAVTVHFCEGRPRLRNALSTAISALPPALGAAFPGGLVGNFGEAPGGNQEEEPVSQEDAWNAMATIEDQLANADDPLAEQSVRQAAQMLRQLLTVALGDGGSALLQMAQLANPDLRKVWSNEKCRQHLLGLLSPEAVKAGASASSAVSAGQANSNAGASSSGNAASSSEVPMSTVASGAVACGAGSCSEVWQVASRSIGDDEPEGLGAGGGENQNSQHVVEQAAQSETADT